MKWEKFDHTHLYDDGEYVVEIDGRRQAIVTAESEKLVGLFAVDHYVNQWCDDNGIEYNADHFTRIFKIDDTPSPVEQANKFLDARFDTIE